MLEALGRHLTDKQQAKAARKAVVKHRSWLANRERVAGGSSENCAGRRGLQLANPLGAVKPGEIAHR